MYIMPHACTELIQVGLGKQLLGIRLGCIVILQVLVTSLLLLSLASGCLVVLTAGEGGCAYCCGQ